jgi:Phage portal protein, SPP1 Gp6-like
MAALDAIADPIGLANRCDQELDRRAGPINRLWDYYRGEVHVLFATAKFREAFGQLLNEISDNWCAVVVDSSVERLRVTGFRFGKDETADEDAWNIWQASQMDADQVQAHEEAGVAGLCYLLVEPPADTDTDLPRISPLSGLEAITVNAPENRRRRIAGYRRFVNELGIPEARLYLPDRALVLMSDPDRAAKTDIDGDHVEYGNWEVVGDIANPAGVVPMVEMLNKPHLGRGGESDLDPILSKQDVINKFLVDAVVNSEFSAYFQRWATGIELETDSRNRPVPPEQLMSGVNSLFVSENDQAKFGAFPASDGKVFVALIEMLVQHIAAQSRTPPHYLTAGLGQWPSADSLRASEEGLVQKCRRKMLGFGENHEETMRISFLMLGDRDRGTAFQLETIWDNPQRVSLAQITDAAVKARQSLDVPRVATWRMIGASPQEIDQWEHELEEERAAEPPEPEVPAGPAAPAPPAPPPGATVRAS